MKQPVRTFIKKPEDDAAMLAVLHPFARDVLAVDDGAAVLLVNGVQVAGLSVFDHAVLQSCQWWRGAADQLGVSNAATFDDLSGTGTFDAVLVRLPRQREEARFALYNALKQLRVGGLFVAAAANDAGGARLYADLAPFISGLQEMVKHKSRIVWAEKTDAALLPDAWDEQGRPLRHPDTGLWTQAGLFSWDRVDAATKMLLPFLPNTIKGAAADLGCGTGVIADHLLSTNPDLRRMVCYDADARAVQACRRNLSERHSARDMDYHWVDLSLPVTATPVDFVVMNPPFHAEKALAVGLGQSFIANAAAMLKRGGVLFMVANAHLPYENTLAQSFHDVRKLHEGGGFKIITAKKQA